MNKEQNELKEQIFKLKQKLMDEEAESSKLKDEVELYKGRCANLSRDIQLSGTAMDKLNTDAGSL